MATKIGSNGFGFRRFARALAILGLLGAAGCASGTDEFNDPYENTNREIFAFNMVLDENIARPVAQAYRDNVPAPLRTAVRNVLRNLDTPVIFLNEVLQGDGRGAQVAATRFFLNSFLGLGGLIDIAGYNKELEFQSEDFGQTLAVWGVEEGPYLVVPLFGPSNPRDLVGSIVDAAADPFRYVFSIPIDVFEFGIARGTASFVDSRESVLGALEEIEASSLDFYAAIRTLYRQNRNAEIRDGAVEEIDIPVFEDFEDFETFDDAEATE